MSNYLILAYYNANLVETFNFLDKISSLYDIKKIIFVNNSALPILSSNSTRDFVIKGSNRIREFSAWDEGYLELVNSCELSENDNLFFINDTIIYNPYLRYIIINKSHYKITHFINAKNNESSILAPIVNSRIGSFELFDSLINDYIATFFLLLNNCTFKKIKPFTPDIDWDLYLNTLYSNHLFIGNVSQNYLDFYNAWLGCTSKDGIGRWKKSYDYPYNFTNHKFLYGKAQCILLESYVTAMCNKNNVKVINLYPNKMLHFLFRLFFQYVYVLVEKLNTIKNISLSK